MSGRFASVPAFQLTNVFLLLVLNPFGLGPRRLWHRWEGTGSTIAQLNDTCENIIQITPAGALVVTPTI